ncbi:MAG: hypothetical protein LCH62_14170 [Proteobacteria bacterium]|nr:hypothetical protein [Pseudomonadota bacterium]
MTAIPLTDSAVKNVKRALVAHFSSPTTKLQSSHLSEALAAACGFNSNAALVAAMKVGPINDPDYVLLDEAAFLERLTALSNCARNDNFSSFSFDKVHFSSPTETINTYSPAAKRIEFSTSTRKRAWRNMMVAGINEGIERRLFTVRRGDNRWPKPQSSSHSSRGIFVYEFSISSIPALASVSAAGDAQLSIHVALWPTLGDTSWIRTGGAGFFAGEAFATGYLERDEGAWLQVPSNAGGTPVFACRRKLLKYVSEIKIRPRGYADRGAFRL